MILSLELDNALSSCLCEFQGPKASSTLKEQLFTGSGGIPTGPLLFSDSFKALFLFRSRRTWGCTVVAREEIISTDNNTQV